MPGHDSSIELRKGRHKLTFISAENPIDQYSILFEVPENDIEDCIEVDLKPIRDKRLADEAEERRSAYEAEQRRIRETKEREEIQRKRIEEERKKREEEERRRREEERIRRESEERSRAEKQKEWEERERRYRLFFKARDEYKEYAITKIPSKSDNSVYYVEALYVEAPYDLKIKTIPKERFVQFERIKSTGEPSKIIPALKKTQRLIHFKQGDLIDYFADVSFESIKGLCKTAFEVIPSLFGIDELYPQITLSVRKNMTVNPYERESIKQVQDSFDRRNHFRREFEISQVSNKEHDPTLLCQVYFWHQSLFGKTHRREVNLATLNRNDKNAAIEFFFYMVANNQNWKDFYYKILDSSYSWKESTYRDSILQLKQSSDYFTEFKCECIESRLVYIDEACNEIIDATANGADAISNVSQGIMVWDMAPSPIGKGPHLYSFRDYKGHELFNLRHVEPESRYQPTALILPDFGDIFHFRIQENGYTLPSFGRQFWISGISNNLSDIEDKNQIENKDLVFKNPQEQITLLGKTIRCFKISGRYYLSTYQGLLEIDKPKDWDEAIRHREELRAKTTKK